MSDVISEDEKALPRPTLHFESVTFSDGTTLNFDDDDIVVFVGPNNAGKSAALREMQEIVSRRRAQQVVKDAVLRQHGDSGDLRVFLEKNAQKTGDLHEPTFCGIGYQVHTSHIGWFDNQNDRHPVATFFCSRLATETRIAAANAASSIALYRDPPSHPIHVLLTDDKLSKKISGLFHTAFQKDLIPFRAGGGSFPLYVGDKPMLNAGEDELSKSFVERLLSSTLQLEGQGDGMRSFVAVLLYTLVGDTHSIQFLDEPEAFLHPPQARLIGETIGRERRAKSQLFIATHSTDVLDGLITGGANKVRIVRMQRDGLINRVKELNKERTAAIATDTLARYSGVFSGIFYQHVVVCEADSDCLFYHSMLRTAAVSGDRNPDVLFVHASGKHRMVALVETLRALDVAVSVIADIDMISEAAPLERLLTALGGNWSEIESHREAIADSVQKHRPPLVAGQVTSMIEHELNGVSGTGEFPKDRERNIKKIFKTLSPWDNVKHSGRSALAKGGAVTHFDQLAEKCSSVGLWLVPVGELEGFCRSIEASHGPAFVEKVLSERDLEGDPELADARAFVSKI